MDKINILHLSDLHICKNKEFDVEKILAELRIDVQKLNEQHGKINYICFTGDMISRGDQAWTGETQFELAMDQFMYPLIAITGIDSNNFIIVPGNHEVDTSKINEEVERELLNKLVSKDAVNFFLDKELKETHLARMQSYYDFAKTFLCDRTWSNEFGLGSSLIRKSGETSLGFACLDSSWRASGKGDEDKSKLIIGQRQIERAYKAISNCDIKIALFHHPIYWLAEFDQDCVETSLRKFDIVLTGHLHKTWDKQVIAPNQQTLFSSCGSLFQGRSNFNGYSLLSINPYTKEVEAYFRQHYDERNCFDKALKICDDGHFKWQLNCSSPGLKHAFRLFCSMKTGLAEKANNELLSNIIDKSAPQEIKDLFVPQLLSKESEYKKEEEDRQDYIELDELIQSKNNILILGRKEIGKSTLLNYLSLAFLDTFEEHKNIPFIIDLRIPLQGIEPIEKSMSNFVSKISNPSEHLTFDQVKEMLPNNNCIILFDNLDCCSKKDLAFINEFTSKYPNNRFIFTMNEDIFHTVLADELPNLGCKCDKVYLHTYRRNSIRKLTSKWFTGRNVDIDQLLDKVMLYLRSVSMPRTPFNVSLILAICSNYQEDSIPVNEASVMERFMEIVLEKLSPDDTYRNTYDFKIKEDFLSFLAWNMAKSDKYEVTFDEFLSITKKYFDDMGLSLKQSKFDKLFFDKKILIDNNGMVYFRYYCLSEYYLAKKAIKDPEVLNWLLSGENYLNHINELCFFTGLERNRKDILSAIDLKLAKIIEKNIHLLESLENYNLNLELDADPEELKGTLKKGKLTDDQRDELADTPDNGHKSEKPKVITPNSPSEGRVFYKTLYLYGRIIKNNELVDKETKLSSLKICILGFRVFLAAIIELIEYNHQQLIEEEKEEDTKKGIEISRELLTITAPMVIQNIAAETVGTAKLAKIIKQVMDSETNEFAKFMYVFLYSDLRMTNCLEEINKFRLEVLSRDLLKLVTFKLIFYYHIRYFRGTNEVALENMIGECILSLKKLPSKNKTNVLNELRRKEVRIPMLLREGVK